VHLSPVLEYKRANDQKIGHSYPEEGVAAGSPFDEPIPVRATSPPCKAQKAHRATFWYYLAQPVCEKDFYPGDPAIAFGTTAVDRSRAARPEATLAVGVTNENGGSVLMRQDGIGCNPRRRRLARDRRDLR
jgi:hypothetical protein